MLEQLLDYKKFSDCIVLFDFVYLSISLYGKNPIENFTVQ